MARIATSDRFKITVSSMPGPWDTLSGQEVTREVPAMRQEAAGAKVAMPTNVEYGDITVTRLYDQDRDGALYREIAKGKQFRDSVITVTELDADGIPIAGAQTNYNGCTVKSASAPDADANGTDTAKLTVVFSVASVS